MDFSVIVALQVKQRSASIFFKSRSSGAVKGYSFNTATENISATRHLLAKKIGLADVEESGQADLGDAA